jgi:hypothetical protein
MMEEGESRLDDVAVSKGMVTVQVLTYFILAKIRM